MLYLCQHGYEALLERELTEAGRPVAGKGPGWALTGAADAATEGLVDLVFPHLALAGPREFKGESVNALAQQLADFFLESMRGERIDAEWPCVFSTVPEVVGLGRRATGVEKALDEILRKKLSRVAKLARPELPRGAGPARGLFVFFADFGRVFAARAAVLGGQRRMADDTQAPSRSYLKVEEAYIVLGREPQPDETVVDLGAAPGGWSYSGPSAGPGSSRSTTARSRAARSVTRSSRTGWRTRSSSSRPSPRWRKASRMRARFSTGCSATSSRSRTMCCRTS